MTTATKPGPLAPAARERTESEMTWPNQTWVFFSNQSATERGMCLLSDWETKPSLRLDTDGDEMALDGPPTKFASYEDARRMYEEGF